jgi:hypothetical protein
VIASLAPMLEAQQQLASLADKRDPSILVMLLGQKFRCDGVGCQYGSAWQCRQDGQRSGNGGSVCSGSGGALVKPQGAGSATATGRPPCPDAASQQQHLYAPHSLLASIPGGAAPASGMWATPRGAPAVHTLVHKYTPPHPLPAVLCPCCAHAGGSATSGSACSPLPPGWPSSLSTG